MVEKYELQRTHVTVLKRFCTGTGRTLNEQRNGEASPLQKVLHYRTFSYLAKVEVACNLRSGKRSVCKAVPPRTERELEAVGRFSGGRVGRAPEGHSEEEHGLSEGPGRVSRQKMQET